MREFDERIVLQLHSESYIIAMQQDKKLSKKCLGGRAKGEIRTPCFCVENAPAVSRGGIIFGVFVLHFVLHRLKNDVIN